VDVSHSIVNGAAVSSVPRFAPSSRNWTPATPTLSAAVAVIVVVPETVAPFAGAVTLTVGGGVWLQTVTGYAAEVVAFPAASRVRAFPTRRSSDLVDVSHSIVNGAAVSSVPRFAPSSRNWTPATPTLSAAVAVIVVVPETVAPFAGAVTLTV